MLTRELCAAGIIVAGLSPALAAETGPLASTQCVDAKKKMDADFAASSKDVDVRATGVCMFYPQLITKAKAKVAYLTSCPAADGGGQLAAAQAEIAANQEKMKACKN